MYVCITAKMVCLVALASPSISPCRTAPTTVELVEPAFNRLLPENLQAFYSDHRLELIEFAATDQVDKGRDSSGPLSRHFIAIDVLRAPATSNTRETGNPLVRRSKAGRIFKERGISNGGCLPWALLDAGRDLTLSFRRGEIEPIVRQSAVVLHFAVDANLPFNTTSDPDGRAAGNLAWTGSEGPADLQPHRSVWRRIQLQLIRRQHERLAYELRVWPNRLRQLSDPAESVWRSLLSANDALEELLAIDRKLTAELKLKDAQTFQDREEQYYDTLGDDAGPLIETRLESAALLAARMVVSAWSEAARPTLSTESSDTGKETAVPGDRDATVAPYVGSRNSQVFHRRTCQHVRRIRPENLVQFSSFDEASRAGRRPCKACSPQP